MFALVESGTITQFPKGNKGITIGDNQYPKTIYSLWTEAERNAIGIYTVAIDSTNKKDETFYINTDVTYTFTGSAVTGTYGTATAKRLNDENAVDEDGNNVLDADGNQVINYGLKTQYKNKFNAEAAGLLSRTDWYVIKAADVTDYSVPSNITTYRAAVRTKVNSMETQIDGCSDVDALITLLTYTEDSEGVVSRPLGEFPDEVV
nr:N-acetylmuramidase/lysin [uncultured Mediterranean phage uvMED]